jgi:hypothetical protein
MLKVIFSARTLNVMIWMMLVFLLVSCESAVEYAIIDEREVLGNVYTENTNPIDNRMGTSDLVQSISIFRQFSPNVRVNLRPNSRLDQRDVEQRILNQYFAAGVEDRKNCAVPVSVPPGSAHVIEIQWTEVRRQGRIEQGRQGGGEVLGDYNLITDLRCEVVGLNVVR